MKTLNSIIETFRAVAKHEQGVRKPGAVEPGKKFKDNTPTSLKGNLHAPTQGAQEFIDDHDIEMVADRNGNGDDVFKASNVKAIERKKEKHGYNAKDSEAVNEMSKAQMKKREEIVTGMKKNLSSFKSRYGKDAKSVMYATATKRAMGEETEVAEAVDHMQKAKENVDFHHGQSTDYAKEIQNMLGQYKKDAGKNKHLGDWHASDMAQVHQNLRQAHDTLKYACMGVKPPEVVKLGESVEHQEEKFDDILEAVHAHQAQLEEQELVEAYASILESIYEGLETDEEKQQFNEMLDSEDAFDELVDLVESSIKE